jgi:mono/diheme cytochrome c family protein
MRLTKMFLLGAAMAIAGNAQAQEVTLGEFEYRNSCAVCHGVEGRGDGPLAEYMTVP